MNVLRPVLRRGLADAVALVTVVVLVTVTAALAAVAPRLHSRTADEALARIIDAAPPAAQELTLRSTNDFGLEQLELIDEQVRSSLDGPLRGLVGPATFALVTPRYDSFAWPSGRQFHPRPYAWLKLRHQSDLLDKVRWVRGREPRSSGTATLDGTPGGDVVPRLEVALDEGVAGELGMTVGDRVLLRPLEGQLGRGGPVLVDVTGLYAPRDPDDVAWDHDPLMRSPGLEVTAGGELFARYASALTADAEAVRAAAATVDLEWHYPVRTSGIDADNAEAVLRGLEQFSVQGFSVVRGERTYLGAVPGYVAHSGLQDLVQGFLRQAASAEAVVAMVLSGVLLVAVLVVGLATRLLGRRRASVVRLLRARGASWGQLLGLQALEALLLVVPAGVVGHRAAVLAVDSRPSQLSWSLVGGLVVLTVAWATLSSGQEARGAGDPGETSSGRWRWREVLEAVVVLAAAGGVLLVRRRGIGGEAGTGADPLVAAVPVLVALAAAVVALRCYQWASGPLRHAVGRRRGAVGLLGLAAAGRRSGVAAAVVVVVLAGTAFSLFASSVTSTISDGQAEAAYLAVGADYRLDGPGFSDEQAAELASVDGVSAVAPAFVRSGIPVAGSDDTVQDVAFVAVDTESYPAVADAAAPGRVPAALADLTGEPAGDATLRVLVTPGVLAAGDDVSLALGSGIGDVPVEVVGTLDEFPLGGGAETVVADLGVLRESESGLLRATTLLAGGDTVRRSDVVETAAAWDSAVTVTDRRERLATTRALPFVDSTVAIFGLGLVAVAAYAVAAVVMYLLLTSGARAALLGTLRRLGMARGQTRAVAGLELAPLVGLALLAGTATGLGLTSLLAPAVRLTPFTGGATPPDTAVDLGFVLALPAVVGLVVVAATLAVTELAGRRERADLMRTGADE